MKGRMLVYTPFGSLSEPPEITELSARPMYKELDELVDGFVEQVPWFVSIEIDGKLERCVALWTKHNRSGMNVVNHRATLLWEAALQRLGPGLSQTKGPPAGWGFSGMDDEHQPRLLYGTVVVLTGDPEFVDLLVYDAPARPWGGR